MPVRVPLLFLSLPLGAACATTAGRSSGRDYAYARARDSIVVAVSARGRSDDDIQRALEAAVTRVAKDEGCYSGPPQLRGDRDPRLAADALGYLRPPYRIAVASCADSSTRPVRP